MRFFSRDTSTRRIFGNEPARVQERSEAGISDARQIDDWQRLCQDEQRLRALFVFTCADRAEWESEQTDPARWFNTRELYAKTLLRFRPAADPTRVLATAGYSPEQLNILQDFGEDFFGGVYRPYAVRFGAHLVRLVEEPDDSNPKASILRDGASMILGIAARDYRGLAPRLAAPLAPEHRFAPGPSVLGRAPSPGARFLSRRAGRTSVAA